MPIVSNDIIDLNKTNPPLGGLGVKLGKENDLWDIAKLLSNLRQKPTVCAYYGISSVMY